MIGTTIAATMRRRGCLLFVAGVIGLAASTTVAADAEAARRAQIARERDAVQARHAAAVKACDGAFALTACLDNAKRERRRELDRLAGEQAVLDHDARQRRAAERRGRIEQKRQQAAAQDANPASASPVRVPRAAAAASAPPADAQVRGPRDASARAATKAQAASARQAESARRRAEAARHAEAVQRRNAERAARHPPAAPLPPPASGARP